MEQFIINGKNPLAGDVKVSGAKNAAVAVIPASLLVEGTLLIENIPKVEDVLLFVEVLKNLGAKAYFKENGVLFIDSTLINQNRANFDILNKMRASYYLLGALLGRFKEAEISMPGGCDFGCRPIDQHIKGFEAMGAKVQILKNEIIKAKAENLKGTQIYLDVASVGATINLMLAAVKAQGITVIENSAKEPHVVDLANFLNVMGAKIKGAGTDVIKITGVEKLEGGKTYSIIPDQIEAGTFMIAAAATQGDVVIQNVIPKHMESISAKLAEMNVKIFEGDDWIRVASNGKIKGSDIITQFYPGFPTDMQPQMAVLLSLTEGSSIITENVWDNRFQYVDQLKRMKAKIKIDGRTAKVKGIKSFSASTVKATDLRAGAAMVIAALCADGESKIQDIHFIDRGYENFENKLIKLGADIKRKNK